MEHTSSILRKQWEEKAVNQKERQSHDHMQNQLGYYSNMLQHISTDTQSGELRYNPDQNHVITWFIMILDENMLCHDLKYEHR